MLDEILYVQFELDNVFVILEDTAAPSRSEVMQQPPGEPLPYTPTHYRQTYITATPPGSLEQLLDQLRAPWVTARNHPQGTSGPQKLQDSAVQLSVSGFVFAVGTDWIVRAGNVSLTGGTIKGMLLEESASISYLSLILINLVHRRRSTSLFPCSLKRRK